MDARTDRSKAATVACALTAFIAPIILKRAMIWSFVPVYGSVPIYAAFDSPWIAIHEVVAACLAVYAFPTWRAILKADLSSFKLGCELAMTCLAVFVAAERPLLYPLSRHITETQMVIYIVYIVEYLLDCRWVELAFEVNPELFGRTLLMSQPNQGRLTAEMGNPALLVMFAMRSLLYHGTGRHYIDVWLDVLREQVPYPTTLNRTLLQVFMLYLLMVALSRTLRRRAILLVFCILSIAASMSSGEAANRALHRNGDFTILHRGESTTGYLSVLENTLTGLRVLRHDHSLLGGVWLLTPERRRLGFQVEESVFSVFYMLEAVRLMEIEGLTGAADTSKPSNALFIGLGIGTAPSAFAAHGINTTVVELDPAVKRIAKKCFNLHEDVDVQTEDALMYVQYAQASSFDYIVHDVFAGGAEPKALFTDSFLHSLKRLLKPGGSIAINYAGNLHSTSTIETLRRINALMENCKIFRDNVSLRDETIPDFANFVIFCSSSPWSFRKPTAKDFLKTSGRQQYLMPQYEVTESVLSKALEVKGIASDEKMRDREYVNDAKWHRTLMRKVLPDAVWENY